MPHVRASVSPSPSLYVTVLLLAVVLGIVHCGGDESDANGANADRPDGDGADADGGGDRDGGPGPVTSCEPFGRFPAPTKTFTLPAGSPTISYSDIQEAFPDVDWANLERLYIPAGSYKTLQIGNLPSRSAERPLVITNIGGQVAVGPNIGGNFIWSMGGGSGWVLTGRYDPDAKTGDVGFQGHRCGAYADSRGKYGFISDDAFDHSAPYTHMGLAVGGGATDFEIEWVEITRSGFAGMRLLNSKGDAADPEKPMVNVRVHDNYIHDIDSEGIYFGWTGEPPSHLFPKLEVYNNRIVRTGSETLQVQDLGEGSRIHHNVFAYGALHWLDNFGKFQDGNLQILVREGAVEFDHNITLGGAGTLVHAFSAPEPGDGERHVKLHDNFFADTRNLGGYFSGKSSAASSFDLSANFFRGLDFGYETVNPAATDPGVVFGIGDANAALTTFTANTIEGSRKLTSDVALNGTSANVTAKDNVVAAVAPVAFVASGYPDVPTSKLSAWGLTATLAPGQPAIQYAIGDLVMFDAELYRAKVANSGARPPEHPESWEKLPRPADDLRVSASSPYAAMGIR